MNKQTELHSNLQKTCVLMYHGISRMGGQGTMRVNAFEKQLLFLSHYFNFISYEDLFIHKHSDRRTILLTFDDGFQNNFKYAVPVLKRLNIPAILFVATRHSLDQKYLWFSYLKALYKYYPGQSIRIRNKLFYLSPSKRKETLGDIRKFLLELQPHPSESYKVIDQELPTLDSFVPKDMISEYFSGISEDELKQIGSNKLFTIGAHTADHAFLTLNSDSEARDQIQSNKDFLESAIGERISTIAYPSGEYTDRTISICYELGLSTGFAVNPNRPEWNYQDIPRIGIYSESLVKMMIKIFLGNQFRRLRVKVG